jgi:hypothetical protein
MMHDVSVRAADLLTCWLSLCWSMDSLQLVQSWPHSRINVEKSSGEYCTREWENTLCSIIRPQAHFSCRLWTRTRGGSKGVVRLCTEMMSATLVVFPLQCQQHGPVPLHTSSSPLRLLACLYSDSHFICALLATEMRNDLTATERAVRTLPDAPPCLPPIPFADHAEEMSRILLAPELIKPPPIL